MKNLFMNNPIRAILAVICTALVPAVLGCPDAGDPVTQDTPVTATPASVTLAPGQQTTVVISGGTPPYGVTDSADANVATVELQNPTGDSPSLVITALTTASAGTATSVSVGDADEFGEGGALGRTAHGEDEVTIPITIALGTAVSFANDVQPIFTANCAVSGCHAGNTPQSGLSLEAGDSYAQTVNVTTVGTLNCSGQPRVDPGSSATSALYKLVSGSCGPRMPWSLPPGSDSLTTTEQNTIREWIDQGASNN